MSGLGVILTKILASKAIAGAAAATTAGLGAYSALHPGGSNIAIPGQESQQVGKVSDSQRKSIVSQLNKRRKAYLSQQLGQANVRRQTLGGI